MTDEWGTTMENCPTPMTRGEKQYWATVLLILFIVIGTYVTLIFHLLNTA